MSAPVAGSATSADDLELLARLRRGDEAAFTQLVERLHGPMLRVAMIHVGNRAVAEEVAQDAWVGVLAQLDRFEGRSSLRTWVLRIVANRARTRAVRERRTLPFSSLDGLEEPAGRRSSRSGSCPPATAGPATGRRRHAPGARCPRSGCCRPRPGPRSSGPSSGCRRPSGR